MSRESKRLRLFMTLRQTSMDSTSSYSQNPKPRGSPLASVERFHDATGPHILSSRSIKVSETPLGIFPTYTFFCSSRSFSCVGFSRSRAGLTTKSLASVSAHNASTKKQTRARTVLTCWGRNQRLQEAHIPAHSWRWSTWHEGCPWRRWQSRRVPAHHHAYRVRLETLVCNHVHVGRHSSQIPVVAHFLVCYFFSFSPATALLIILQHATF